jgi:hypothetical protein
MIDNPEEQLQRVVNRLRKVVEDYSAQVIDKFQDYYFTLFDFLASI